MKLFFLQIMPKLILNWKLYFNILDQIRQSNPDLGKDIKR